MNHERLTRSAGRTSRRAAGWAVTAVLVLVACSTSPTATPTNAGTTSPAGPSATPVASPSDGTGTPPVSPSTPSGGLGVADLAAAGVEVYADTDTPNPLVAVPAGITPTPLRMLQVQADAELLEAFDHQGVPGSELDQLIGAPPGMLPASYFVAGWISNGGSPAALLAQRIMGEPDWTTAPTILFPNLVLSLYTADAARFANVLAGQGDATPATTDGSPAPSVPASGAGFLDNRTHRAGLVMDYRTIGICSKVQNFIDTTIAAVFDALGHLESPQVPSTGFAALDLFGAGIQKGFDFATGVVNGLIDGGRFLVVNGIKLAIKPVLEQLAKVAGGLAVVADVVSFLRPWTIRMTPTPNATRKAVGDEPGLPGTVSATVDLGEHDEWPADIADCAFHAGVTLPPLKPAGAPITWKIDQSPGDLIIEDPARATVLDTNAHADAAYITTSEDVETAKGDPRTGVVVAQVSIRRKEIADLQNKIGDLLFAQFPSLIGPILAPLLRPVVDQILAKIPSVLDSTGLTRVSVDYHDKNETTTTSSTTTVPVVATIDPCKLVTEAEAAAALGSDPGPGVNTPVSGGHKCSYGTYPPATLTVLVSQGPAFGSTAQFEAGQALQQGYVVEGRFGPHAIFNVLSGIGERAFETGAGSAGTVTFNKTDTTVAVIILFSDISVPTPTPQAEALATMAAARF